VGGGEPADGRGAHVLASVAAPEEGGYEAVRCDSTRNEHEVIISTGADGITREPTVRTAARRIPGRPTNRISTFSNTVQPAGQQCCHAALGFVINEAFTLSWQVRPTKAT